MSKYADLNNFVAGRPVLQEMEQYAHEYAVIKSEIDKRRAKGISAKENDTQLIVSRETMEMFLEAGAELGRLNQAWHDGDRSESTLNQLRLANIAAVTLNENIKHMLQQHKKRVEIRQEKQKRNESRDAVIVEAAKERRDKKKKSNPTVNAIVDWLIEQKKTPLGKTRTREIVEHLWEEK